MNSLYKNKYFKYKSKYLELKNIIKFGIIKGGGDIPPHPEFINYKNQLKKLYPSVVFDNVNKSNPETIYATTYGEMNYEGLDEINRKYNSDNKIKYFFDIGSGRGKLVLWQAALPEIIKSYGIELVEQRHQDAVDLLNKIKTSGSRSGLFDDFTSKVNFINADVFDVDLSKLINLDSNTNPDSSPGVLIWFSNLCFSKDINEKIFDKIIAELPKGTIITCSQSSNNPKLQLIEQISIPMSWSPNNNVYVYKT